MSSGFHYLGANAGKLPLGFSNRGVVEMRRAPQQITAMPSTETSDPTLLSSERPMGRAEARSSGYTGDQCSNCQSMKMQIAGHCMVCADCGTTTGCS